MTFPALFLDRDGVINIETHYVYRIEDFVFMEGIFSLCQQAVRRGFKIVVITNQSGIARGFYSERDFLTLTAWMTQQFAQQGITLAAVYYCPYHEIEGIGQYKKASFDRKPNPGMIFKAQHDLNLNLTASILIGDKVSDIEAAKAANIGTAVLLADDTFISPIKPDLQADTLTAIEGLLFE